MTNLETLKKARPFLAWAEVAALLHDLGKLSAIFLEYRRKWQTGNSPWHYGNDPHEDVFVCTYDSKICCFQDLFCDLITPLGRSHIKLDELPDPIWKKLEHLSIAGVCSKHTGFNENSFIALLKWADSKDSQWDRNNPLFCNEQFTKMPADTDIFGMEDSRTDHHLSGTTLTAEDAEQHYRNGYPPRPHLVDPEDLDRVRKELYLFLDEDRRLAKYFKSPCAQTREQIFGAVRWAFDQAMSDTTRPCNDTTLWEHCYSVMAIFKAGLVKALLEDKWPAPSYDGISNLKFRLLGAGWDGLRFLSEARKMGDVLGRAAVLDKIRNEVRQLVEWKIPIGSLVYFDINNLVFLVPDYENEELAEKFDIKNLIRELFIEQSDGDIIPHIKLSKPTDSLTSIVKLLNKLDKVRKFPVPCLEKKEAKLLGGYWKQDSQEDICTVCHRRPAKKGDFKPPICEQCHKRRVKASEQEEGKTTSYQ
ncbi:MAG: hypothetical protein QMD09_14835, partial [Desulfatibacillaceae bacterium]|nr:hypothetical protein [Desulfatibacillaceae bacterium]